jgi:hypothetical protein
MPKIPKIYLIIGGVVLVVVIGIMIFSGRREGMKILKPVSSEYKPGFLPSRQGPYMQGMPPSLRVENDYHGCIMENGGDYGDYFLRQKCYVKTLKNGTFDKADLMCWNERHDEDAYYACLDNVYGNVMWADRFVGLKPCLCADGSEGSSNANDECVCPDPIRPLHDRREVNEFNQILDTPYQRY